MKTDETIYMVLDWETFSEAPLREVGAYEYSLHQSTEILCAAFRIGTRATLKRERTRVWYPDSSSDAFAVLLNALRNSGIQLVAQNALFEILITKNVFHRRYMPSKPELLSIPLERWHCTAAMSRSVGLPGKLDDAAIALNLPHKKDKEGHALMLRISKPKKPSKKDPSTRIQDFEKIRRLGLYCARDVDAEVDLFLELPPLHPREREFWLLDQAVNLRGFAVDRQLVKGALSLIADETKRLDRRVEKLTGGSLQSARQREKLLQFLKIHGIDLPNLQAHTVSEYLANHE